VNTSAQVSLLSGWAGVLVADGCWRGGITAHPPCASFRRCGFLDDGIMVGGFGKQAVLLHDDAA
jgi:hypothetical protein